ncbi:MAG: metalloregulator ArsR/SmtB family transcription factor [Chloroflexota bacterium]|nr:metalloregulator ArsR/SmtB family transcription factor [Chloroflexota bacterium]
MDDSLLATLRALSDASRLRIVGLLATRRMAVEELADSLRLSPATVVHHLKRLKEAGLVEAVPRRPYVEYSLRVDRLHDIGRRVNEMARSEALNVAELAGPDGAPRPAFDAKVLRAFFEEGRLARIPAQEKKRLVVLRYLAETLFREPRSYPEKEVNERLATVHPDVASLRRYLVDHGFMSRAAGQYTLNSKEQWPQ